MSLNLSKGGKLDLTKNGKTLNVARLDLSWGPKVFDTQKDFDLDVSIFALKDDPSGKYPFGIGSESWVIYYNQLESPGKEIVHSGDERTGKSAGVDEAVRIRLNDLPAWVTKLHVVVTIHEAVERGQNFGQVPQASIGLFNDESSESLATRGLDGAAVSTATSMLFVEFSKSSTGWTFGVIEEGFQKGLADFIALYGM